jgi:hypothetical protein
MDITPAARQNMVQSQFMLPLFSFSPYLSFTINAVPKTISNATDKMMLKA